MKLGDSNIFQPSCNIRYDTSLNVVSSLFEIFKGMSKLILRISRDMMDCYILRVLTQNSGLGVHQVKMRETAR